VEDQRDWLLAQGFGRRASGKALPAQATLYRFVWALEQQVSALEAALKAWALEVLKALHPGQMVVHLDGKYLKGSARRGDQALLRVSAYLGQLGLSLWQGKALGDEAVAGRRLIVQPGPELSGLGRPW
jgi:hypothetical protein